MDNTHVGHARRSPRADRGLLSATFPRFLNGGRRRMWLQTNTVNSLGNGNGVGVTSFCTHILIHHGWSCLHHVHSKDT
jgi:hypothetical protein